jgi:thymidylate synthase
MAKIDKEYHLLLKTILADGFRYEDPNRKDIFRYQIPSYQIVHDLTDSFPAITTKKLHWKSVVGELLWFLRGDTNIKYLVDNNINIWNKDAYNYYLKHNNINVNLFKEDSKFKTHYDYWLWSLKQNKTDLGDLGRIYGTQWRDFKGFKGYTNAPLYDIGIDQISNLITNLRNNPMSTQHIVTAWNPAELDDMALPPCHWSFEILVEPIRVNPIKFRHPNSEFAQGRSLQLAIKPEYQFTLKWHQRSVDTFLGLPFNIASYALLAHIIGKLTNMIPKTLIGDLSNVHIYENHLDAVKEQLIRDTTKYNGAKFTLLHSAELLAKKYDNINIDQFLDKHDIEEFILDDYESYPSIKAEMLSYNK